MMIINKYFTMMTMDKYFILMIKKIIVMSINVFFYSYPSNIGPSFVRKICSGQTIFIQIHIEGGGVECVFYKYII